MSFLKNNKKVLLPVGIVIAIIVVGTGILSAQVGSDKISKNVLVAGINLEGKTKTEALEILKSQAKFKNVNLKHGKLSWKVDVNDIDLKIDFPKTVDKAYMSTRSGGFFANAISTLKADFGSENKIPLVMDRKSTRLNSSHANISYAVFCLKKKKKTNIDC